MERSRPIGIRDVAEAAGVSPTTVSHALNGKGRIAEATKKKVLQVAEQLGYKPNPSAQRLVSGGGGLIALIAGATVPPPGTVAQLPDIMFLTNVAVSASTAAASLGYGLVLGADPKRLGEMIDLGIDGALILDPALDDPSASSLSEAGIPFVTIGRVPGAQAEENPYWVDSDHRKATRAMLDHLAEAGAERVTLVSGNSRASYETDSIEAYEDWCDEAGVETSVIKIASEPRFDEAEAEIRSTLTASTPPDAVLCLLHPIAQAIFRIAEDLGLKLPDDLLIATISDDSWVNLRAYGHQEITGTDLNPQQLATEATNMLVAIIGGEEPEPPQVFVESKLIPRGSTSRTKV